jgi:hypothetical protein
VGGVKNPDHYSLRNTFNARHQKLRVSLRMVSAVQPEAGYQNVLAETPVSHKNDLIP